jgi:hypothetical protein
MSFAEPAARGVFIEAAYGTAIGAISAPRFRRPIA